MDDNIESTQSGDEVETNSHDALLHAFLDDHQAEHDEDALVIDADEPEVNVEAEAETETDGDEADKQADDADPILKIKVDGKEVTVKQSELIADAQKYRSADGRFREAAEIRKQHETALAEVQNERAVLNAALTKYTDELKRITQQEEPDWNALAAENPAEYVRQKHAFDQKQRELAQLQAAQAYLQGEQAKEHAKQREQFVQAETQKLFDAIPSWKDTNKAKTESAAVSKYLSDMGFDAEAQASIVDHRLILISRKAMLYDQAVNKSKQTANTAAKPVTRNERPTTVKPQSPNKRANAEKAFKTNPNKDTLAAFFE
ncbi:hypothetical protein [Caballeronia sp. AZ1_KS37]|uniref:hypothetical protein n=1 Tax=Caballeronia sp. AZ1_KS37 TaxID=2921756 RepID=UPI0020293894|nr:hypothetical protein [Caballeronia sp. AZ1_KS37]